jgi:hypothetical protein
LTSASHNIRRNTFSLLRKERQACGIAVAMSVNIEIEIDIILQETTQHISSLFPQYGNGGHLNLKRSIYSSVI